MSGEVGVDEGMDTGGSRRRRTAIGATGLLALALVVRVGGGGGAVGPVVDPPAAPIPADPDAGPEAAVLTVDRIQLFRTGNAGRQLELDGAHLTALLRHAVPGMIPDGVRDPAVLVEGGEVWVHATVLPAELPGGEALSEVLAVLPETVDVELRGVLRSAGRAALDYRIERATVGGLPLPTAVIVALVRSLPGGRTDPGDGSPLLRAPWSAADGTVTVADGLVVVYRPEPIVAQSVDGSDGA